MASLAQLKELYERVTSSERSSFYRDLYSGAAAPTTKTEWCALPFLSKNDIARTPYNERIFIDPREVDIVRLTSGTSGSGVLAVPRAHMAFTKEQERLMPVSSYMGLLLPHQIYDNYAAPGTRFVGGDPARLRESAILAAKMEIEGIGALPSTLIAFAEELSAVYDIRRIRHLCFNGDICTKLQRAAIERLYPSVATFVSSYGSSESQGLCAISTPYEADQNALLGHPLVHYEFIDESGNIVEETGRSGELVITLLYEKAAFPLMRYKTGDTATIIELDDDRTVFSILGRAESERVRFSAGAIVTSQIEYAVMRAGSGFITDFEAVVSEAMHEGRPRLSLSISLVTTAQRPAGISAEQIARTIEKEMLVSERRSYADAIEREACTPISCVFVPPDHGRGRKRKRLTDARER